MSHAASVELQEFLMEIDNARRKGETHNMSLKKKREEKQGNKKNKIKKHRKWRRRGTNEETNTRIRYGSVG
jgi:hypothetical protein